MAILPLQTLMRLTVPQIWDTSLSQTEQLAAILAKLNECIDAINTYTGQDLSEITETILQGWYDDGTLEDLLDEILTAQIEDLSDLDERATLLENRMSKVFNVKYPGGELTGAAGNGTTDDQAAIQAIIDEMESGDILYFPAGTYKIINATGTGGTLAAARANAVSNETLYPLTISKDNCKIIIDGDIRATSPLEDVFKITASNVQISGVGSVSGPGGLDAAGFLDTNSEDPLEQWNPSLFKITGENCLVSGLKLIDAPTNAVYIAGNFTTVRDCRIYGGRVVHGNGTKLFGIAIDGNDKGDYSVIDHCLFTENAIHGKPYSAFFNAGGEHVTVRDCKILKVSEHGIYSYGEFSMIIGNSGDMTDAVASAIQVFAENCQIADNYFDNCGGGGLTLQRAINTIVRGNTFKGCGVSGISYRTYYSDDDSYIAANLTISDNIVEMDETVSDRQSPIDIRPAYNMVGLIVRGNTVSKANNETAAMNAGIILLTLTPATYKITDFQVSDNAILDSDGFAIYIEGAANGIIKGNVIKTWYLVGSGGETNGIRLLTATGILIVDNIIIAAADDSCNYAILESTGALGNAIRGNLCLNLSEDNPISTAATSERDGNRKANLPLAGYVTMPNANEGVFTHSQSAGIAGIMSGAIIVITPKNAAAAALQGSAKFVYVHAASEDSLTLKTADGNATGGTTAEFYWRAIQ